LAKVALIIILAGFFSRRHLAAWQNKNIFISLLYTLIPAGIIVIQPDMGSAIVVLGIWVGFLALSGINKKKLFIGILLVVIAFGIMWTSFLEDYQKDRIIGFISPEVDSLGINYNVTQSKIAVGSAGFWGKGFGNGTQVQFDFLPEAHTDFIFASFVEEWGIFGGLILLLTYVAFIFRITTIGLRARRNDFKFIALGTGLVFLIHFFINIGSSLGIVPVIGISFPFVSYGGSNLLTSSLLLAIISSGTLDNMRIKSF
jgi:rod shape determining protein RodA